jgi:hypothetical protein
MRLVRKSRKPEDRAHNEKALLDQYKRTGAMLKSRIVPKDLSHARSLARAFARKIQEEN